MASYCFSYRYSPGCSPELVGGCNTAATRRFDFGCERDVEPAAWATASGQLAVFDPVVNGSETDAQLSGDLIHAQLTGLESRCGWHAVDVADPFDSRHIERSSCASLYAACVE